ncbi:MAG: NADH-quinone oxidoreductase subunit [Acidimicrobiaceae bacterium]
MSDPVRITVNGREIEAEKGQLVIDAAEKHGTYIPRFCYHPRMKSVGMCRMCIVDIDTGRGPALQPACMIECTDGMVVDTESETTKKAQDGVLEFLLINHPLDCPVCDKGGECPLQDNAYAYGPGESRFVEEKRHYPKPIPISEVVFLDRERCILCDRCTRFADEVAGDPLISFIGRGSQTEVNTFPDHPFASYFSGNVVQICPVGALTAKPFRFKARPWDLEKVESTCTACSVGCRVTIEASRNHVLREQGVDIDPVNWGWLCDKGRFGFEAIESEDRLHEPMIKKGTELIGASWAEALGVAGDAIKKAASGAVAVLGGARLTNEAAYAWAKLAKGVIGTDHVDAQLGDGLPADVVVSLPAATIDEVCAPGGTVVVLSGDIKEELPVLFLRLRDAVVNHKVKVIELSAADTGLTPLAAASIRFAPGEAHDAMQGLLSGPLLDGDTPLTAIVGRPSIAESPASVVEAAAALLDAKPSVKFLVGLRRANVRGAIDMGLAPGLLPGRVTLDAAREWFGARWPRLPDAPGLDALGILQAAADGKIDVLVLLGADPIADFPDRELAKRALSAARTVIAVDTFLTESSRQADVVLAAAGHAETGGSTTNLEGRISIVDQKVTPPGTARADWMIAAELAFRIGADLQLESTDDIWDEIEEFAPAHAGITPALLASPAVADGVLVPLRADVAAAAEGTPVAISGAAAEADTQGIGTVDNPGDEVAAEDVAAAAPPEPVAAGPAPLTWTRPARYETPARDSYSLRLHATRKLYDLGTIVQHAPSLAGLAGGSELHVNGYDLERLGVADGGRVKVSSSRGSVTLEAHVDAALPKGTAHLTVNQPGADPSELIDATAPVTDIRIESSAT